MAAGELIQLAFTPRNEVLVGAGLKRATTRRSIHGRLGSVFRAAGRLWMIRAIIPTTLEEASRNFFFLEGETSPAAFLDNWRESYRLPFAFLGDRVYVHVFQGAPAELERPARSAELIVEGL